MKQNTKDYLHLHFIVMVWGFTAVLGELISLGPVILVLYRTLLAAIGLLLLLFFFKKPIWIQEKRDLTSVVLVGVLLAAHWILFFLAARLSNVSVCLAGMATTSIWTGLLEPFSKKKKIQGYEIGISILGFIGMAWIFWSELDEALAFLVAVLSALIAAIFTIINGRVIQRQDPLTISFMEMVVSTIVILIFIPFYQQISADSKIIPTESLDWVFLLLLSWVCTVYAFTASIALMRRLSAFAVNLSVNLEPLYGICIALIVFGDSEKMSSGFYFGGGIILLSVLIYPPLNRRMKRRALDTDLMR